MKFNIISKDNGVGLTKDITIIKQLLQEMNHEMVFYDFTSKQPPESADVNLFLELIKGSCFNKSKCNVIIPNPEWYDLRWRQFLPRFSLIMCKTHSAINTFQKYNKNCLYTSFTSIDKFDPTVNKDYNKCIHVAGKSGQKSTDTVFETWKKYPELPKLTIIQDKSKYKSREKLSNVTYIYDRLSDDELKFLQNNNGIHVCPSETEGFGHYIMEALSCKAITVTTNGQPMNEIVNEDRGILCKHVRNKIQNYAVNFYISVDTLYEAVKKATLLSSEEIKNLTHNGRDFFVHNDSQFKIRFKEAIGRLQYERPSINTNLEKRRLSTNYIRSHYRSKRL